jgi:hypothetical protein
MQNTTDCSAIGSHEPSKRRRINVKPGLERKYGQRNEAIRNLRRKTYTTNKTGPRGMPIQRGWHYYIRHTHRPRYCVKKKHKLYSITFPHPKRNRRKALKTYTMQRQSRDSNISP